MLDIQVADGGGGQLVVVVAGEIDLATAPELATALAEARQDHLREIVVDLTSVDFLDSVGVRVLVEATRQAAELDVQLSLRGARGWVARVLEITGVDEFVRIIPSEPAGSGDADR